MSTQLKNAMYRGLILAFIAGGTAFFTTFTQTDNVKLMISAFALPFLATLATRWAGEGGIDTMRADRGDLLEGEAAVATEDLLQSIEKKYEPPVRVPRARPDERPPYA